jgi:pimeloyl-ACP methyl ester carboxylesterase
VQSEEYAKISDSLPDERVKAGVVVIGCPDYRMLMLQRAGERDREARLPHAFLGLVSKLGPRPDILSKKDLLILKGDEDQLVPWSASQGFVSLLPKDRAEVIGFPGVGHNFADEMRDMSAEWIIDWRRRH